MTHSRHSVKHHGLVGHLLHRHVETVIVLIVGVSMHLSVVFVPQHILIVFGAAMLLPFGI